MHYSSLQVREIFHLEFLRELVKAIPSSTFVLKGGSNIRFFFGSIRYSEDMDIDVREIPVHKLQSKCLEIINSRTLLNRLNTFGIEDIVPPDMRYAKQTETVQRFKVHLITSSGEDLFTKIEFSRRGFDPAYKSEAISNAVLAGYYLPPLIIPHYQAEAVLKQKINALVSRKKVEARDVFDLFTLSPRSENLQIKNILTLSSEVTRLARERVYSIDYRQYRGQVVEYLSYEDRNYYDTPEMWDEIRLVVLGLLKRLEG
ncbi:MAG: nucleotidyl transferase AbiEii/AbiGii toxin family protein [Candidatus Auribacterota bacterium]|nr:nucleotidyl transferase AbiEii/AbiGii toxin family protein [Candidatus Auribacterota bacterium]